MADDPKIPNPSRAPWGLVGFLALVALVEAGLARHDLSISNPLVMNWSRGGESLRREGARAQILCLGDSMMKCGVAPRVLERKLGRRSYNFGVLAGTPPMTYFLARRAIESGARPEALVVEFNPSFLHSPPTGSRQWSEMATLGERLEVARVARDPGFFARTLVDSALRSARRRFEVRANVVAALKGEAVDSPTTIHAGWRNGNINGGALLLPAYGFFGTIPPEKMADEMAPPNWKCHPINALYIRRLLHLAEQQKVPVVWLLPPVSPQVQDGRDAVGLEVAYSAFVRAMQDRFPGMVVVDGRRSGYDSSAFSDALHLHARSASALSDDLAAILRPIVDREPGGPRWVELPPFRERPVGVVVEDLEQSRLAVKDFATPRRR